MAYHFPRLNLSRFRIPRIESLRVKLSLMTASLAILVLLVTYYTLSNNTRRTASSLAMDEAGELVNFFSDSVAESVAANDRMQVHLLAKALINHGVHAVMVKGMDGTVLYQSSPDLDDDFLFRSPDAISFAGGVIGTIQEENRVLFHMAKPVRFGQKPAGMIHLWLDRTDLEAKIHRANASVYSIITASFLLMILLGVLALQALFRSLNRLTIAAECIGAGDLTLRVPVHGQDEVSKFCAAFNDMADRLCQARNDRMSRHLETIQAMISVVEAKDHYTQGHCIRVRHYAGEILTNYPELSPEEKNAIETAAVLHDIGKIGIPDKVLLKTGPLTKKEVEILRRHVLVGEKILLHLDSMKDIARWVRHHHEFWNGMGYPDGLNGNAIPFASRVIAVADAIDAMLTDRPYRRGFSKEKTIQELQDRQGDQFCPEIVEHAVSMLNLKKVRDVSITA